MWNYGVSIIHINSSTIAISIVEPQNDADTFINSCGETGERPAIRVMITINDVYVSAKITSDKAKKITVDINYTDDVNDGNINVYDIILGVNKAQLDSIKDKAATNVLNGLNRFAADNGVLNKSVGEVIKFLSRIDDAIIAYEEMLEVLKEDINRVEQGKVNGDLSMYHPDNYPEYYTNAVALIRTDNYTRAILIILIRMLPDKALKEYEIHE